MAKPRNSPRHSKNECSLPSHSDATWVCTKVLVRYEDLRDFLSVTLGEWDTNFLSQVQNLVYVLLPIGVLWSQVKRLEDVDDNDSRNVFVPGKIACEKYARVIRGNLRVHSRASLAMGLIGQRRWILSHTRLVQ